MSWINQIFRCHHHEDELSEELHVHIEEKTEQLMRLDSLSRQDARQAALRSFGNPTLIETRSREVWQWPMLESVLVDLKLAFRRIRKSPGFTATVLLTLAIGIGANAAVFSVINSVLLKALPFPDSGRLVSLWLEAPGAGGLANFTNGLQLSGSMYLTFSQHNRSFDSMGIWAPRYANVTGLAQPERVQTVQISDGILQSLEIPPLAGRWFSAVDQNPHGSRTVMLSYGYWERRFGSDPSVIGRSIQVDSKSYQIIGVMPRGFRIANQVFDLLVPLALDPAHLGLAGFGFNGIGRLKRGISLTQANADVAHLLPVWMDSWTNGPGTNPHIYEQWKIVPSFRLLKQQVIGNVGTVLWVVMATVGLVMVIACTNIANLVLVRVESRHHELAVRAALGAGRIRIARDLLLECVCLGLIGGLLAIGVASAGLHLLVSNGPADLPRLSEISLDARSLLFTFLLSVLSGIVCGSIPALKYIFAPAGDLMPAANRTASAGRTRRRSRDMLVIAQVAMALVLLVSALLMLRTFAALRNIAPGFSDAENIQTVQVKIPEQLMPDARMATRTLNEIADNLAAIPGTSSAGFAAAVPMDNDDPNWDEIQIEGKDYSRTEPPLRLFNYISPGYFESMGTHLVAGRDLTWTDIYDLRPMVLVSENFARENWGFSAEAIGKRVRMFGRSPWQQIIGVVEDVHVHGVDEKAPAIIYWPIMLSNPYTQNHEVTSVRGVTFTIHSNRAGTQLFIGQVQQAVWKVNANLPVASIQTMQETYGRSMARASFTLVMLAIAGSMALGLGVIGIYGVISYTVSRRTREIGIRLALGAQRAELRWMFVRSALTLTGVGIVIGLGVAVVVARLMRTLLFGVSPLDPLSYAAVPLILAVATALASFIPARRAAAINPMDALKAE